MRCDGLVAEVQDWAAGLDEVHGRIPLQDTTSRADRSYRRVSRR
jgi:hypothetical protein